MTFVGTYFECLNTDMNVNMKKSCIGVGRGVSTYMNGADLAVGVMS